MRDYTEYTSSNVVHPDFYQVPSTPCMRCALRIKTTVILEDPRGRARVTVACVAPGGVIRVMQVGVRFHAFSVHLISRSLRAYTAVLGRYFQLAFEY